MNLQDLDAQLLYTITEWLLQHEEGLKDEIRSQYSPPQVELLPSILQGVYEQGATVIIQKAVASALNLNPEIILLYITPEYIKIISNQLFNRG